MTVDTQKILHQTRLGYDVLFYTIQYYLEVYCTKQYFTVLRNAIHTS